MMFETTLLVGNSVSFFQMVGSDLVFQTHMHLRCAICKQNQEHFLSFNLFNVTCKSVAQLLCTHCTTFICLRFGKKKTCTVIFRIFLLLYLFNSFILLVLLSVPRISTRSNYSMNCNAKTPAAIITNTMFSVRRRHLFTEFFCQRPSLRS